MKRGASLCAVLTCLLVGGPGLAATPTTITDRNAPLVKQLELRYDRSIATARSGDLNAYWTHRTAASRTRPPALDSERLRLLAQLLPPLERLQFVRLDATAQTARALYRWRRQDVVQYTVIVYRVEQGEWKIDDFSVKRSGAPSADATRAETLLRQRSEEVAAPAQSLEGPRL